MCSQSILTWHEASDVVGRRVANTFIVIQVLIRNLDPDHQFLLHDVEALLNTGRFYATHDHDVVRGVAEIGQVYSPRNLILNTATAIGSSVGAASAVLSANAKVGLTIWQSGVIPGIQLIIPDNTVKQVARIDNLAFSPGGAGMVIPKNGSLGILAFLPQKPFLWPCIATKSATDGSGTSSAADNPYDCEPPPMIGDMKWLKTKQREMKLKDLNAPQMNRLQQSLEVLVAGVHVTEVQTTGTITDVSCDSDQQMFKDNTVTCQLKGTNLDKVTAVTLQDPSAGAKGATANGTVKSTGDNTTATVSFPACAINQLPKATYQVSIVASGGDTVQKATFAKKDDPLAPTCTAVSNGKSIDCDLSKMSKTEAGLIETVTLSKYDKDTKTFSPAITAKNLDATLKASFNDKAIGTVLASAVPSDVTVQAQVKGDTTAIDTCATPTTITAPSGGSSSTAKLGLELPSPPSATSGKAIVVTVSTLDNSGKESTGFTGKIHFASKDKNGKNDTGAVLPADSTFPTGKSSVAFPVTFKTIGDRTLTVSSSGVTSGSGSITVK